MHYSTENVGAEVVGSSKAECCIHREFAVLKCASPEGKRQLRKPRSRCKENIKVDLKQIGPSDMDWIQLDSSQ
jgi:hypothetical protein